MSSIYFVYSVHLFYSFIPVQVKETIMAGSALSRAGGMQQCRAGRTPVQSRKRKLFHGQA